MSVSDMVNEIAAFGVADLLVHHIKGLRRIAVGKDRDDRSPFQTGRIERFVFAVARNANVIAAIVLNPRSVVVNDFQRAADVKFRCGRWSRFDAAGDRRKFGGFTGPPHDACDHQAHQPQRRRLNLRHYGVGASIADGVGPATKSP